jgi:hypothetical protein
MPPRRPHRLQYTARFDPVATHIVSWRAESIRRPADVGRGRGAAGSVEHKRSASGRSAGLTAAPGGATVPAPCLLQARPMRRCPRSSAPGQSMRLAVLSSSTCSVGWALRGSRCQSRLVRMRRRPHACDCGGAGDAHPGRVREGHGRVLRRRQVHHAVLLPFCGRVHPSAPARDRARYISRMSPNQMSAMWMHPTTNRTARRRALVRPNGCGGLLLMEARRGCALRGTCPALLLKVGARRDSATFQKRA